MKRVGDIYDTELVLNDSDNVLIGSKFFNPLEIEKEDKVWEIAMIQKLSYEMPFIPTMIDYHIKGSAYEFALENIGNMLPIDYYCLDMCDHPSADNVKKMFAIGNNILYKWRAMINDFSIKNNVLIRISDFWEGTIVNQKNKMYFLNIQNFNIKPIDEIQEYILPTNSTDEQTVLRYTHKLANATATLEKTNLLRKANKRELDYIKSRHEIYINRKNKQIANSISKDTIKATLGKEQYNFYFGDSDG